MTCLGHIVDEWVTSNKSPHLFDAGKKSKCLHFCVWMHRTLRILSETCHFSNTKTALLLCFLLLQENTRATCARYTPIPCRVSFLITSRKHSFICSVLNLKNSHIYMLTGKTESGADQKLASVLQASSPCKRGKPEGTRWWTSFWCLNHCKRMCK